MSEKSLDKKYIESESWKCEDSPTGAHHWIEIHGKGIYQCKWCEEVKEYPSNFTDALIEQLDMVPRKRRNKHV